MIAAKLPPVPTYEEWRNAARDLLSAEVAPADILWSGSGLFVDDPPAFMSSFKKNCLTVPRAFVDLAHKAVLHADAARFALLYRVLWRLQTNKMLLEDMADADVVQLNNLARAVRRDEHKMHAFVRFKEIGEGEETRFVAWFEPQHHIVQETADFFVRRFANMRWSIITPEASIHWDCETLRVGPGGDRSDVASEDTRDEDWRIYYQSMFNPARLKVAAMLREMPKRYWRNLPEAQDVPDLIAAASNRADGMVRAGPTIAHKRAGAAHARITPKAPSAKVRHIAEHEAPPADMDDLNAGLRVCRACPLWKDATQAVPGEGNMDQPLLALVGEQPGDQEDLAGAPFAGPAGKMLDRALELAGIDRKEVYVTNAVKHFKFEMRGKRRLHKRPNPGETEICRWWVKHELDLVKPVVTIALGATALSSLAEHKGALKDARGRHLETREGQHLRATVHPSYLLRIPDEDKEREFDAFVTDLRAAKASAMKLAG